VATYGELKTRALRLSDEVGNSDAALVAEEGLREALKYTANRVVIDGLVGTAEYTVLGTEPQVNNQTVYELFGSDFTITDTSAPLQPLVLYVRNASDDGIPYDYRRFLDWKRLKTVPGRNREFIFTASLRDRRPDRSFTINASDQVVIFPEPRTAQVLTLHYKLDPAPYDDLTTPEIPAEWDSILVNGATVLIKEMVRQPDQIINPFELFGGLDRQIKDFEREERSRRGRPRITMHRSYEVT
jgi:hypothetical protein